MTDPVQPSDGHFILHLSPEVVRFTEMAEVRLTIQYHGGTTQPVTITHHALSDSPEISIKPAIVHVKPGATVGTLITLRTPEQRLQPATLTVTFSVLGIDGTYARIPLRIQIQRSCRRLFVTGCIGVLLILLAGLLSVLYLMNNGF